MGRARWFNGTSCRSYGRLDVRKLLAAGFMVVFVAVAATGCHAVSLPQVDAKVFFVRESSQKTELVAVARRVSAKLPFAEAVLRELLKGPTTAERGQGLTSLIPSGAMLRSVSISEAGVARADFSEGLEQGVGGSMRVMGIRRQIETTLKAIPGITSVILSVEGETEGILQP